MKIIEKKHDVQREFKGILGEKVVLEYVEDEDAQKTYFWRCKDTNGDMIAFPNVTIPCGIVFLFARGLGELTPFAHEVKGSHVNISSRALGI